MIEFFDLPNEIIQIIFNYVPHESLRPLVDIRPIRNYVLNAMYPELYIGAAMFEVMKRNRKFTDMVVRNVDECIAFLESTPAIRPKLFYFTQPLDAIIFVTKYPQYLKGAKIGLSFLMIERFSTLTKVFCENYVNNPFPIDQLHSFDLDYLELDEMSNLSKDVTYFVERRFSPIDLKKLSSNPLQFPNLTKLELFEPLTQENMKYLPCQLKSLTCTLEVLREPFEFNFPDSLTILKINIKVATNEEFYFDVESMEKLQTLEIEQDFKQGHKLALNLPVNLKLLTIDEKMRPINNLQEMCPYLIKLHVSKISSEVNPTNTWVQSYPQTLQNLKIPYGEIIDSDSNSVLSSVSGVSATSHISMAKGKKLVSDILSFIPRNLRMLQLIGNREFNYDMLLDFEETDFVELYELEIKFATNLYLYGDLPVNLTKLTLNCMYIHEFNLNQLLDLQNLCELSLSSLKEIEDFSFDFPESLLKLEIIDCTAPGFFISASNLQELKISGQFCAILDDSNVSIPQSVKRLSFEGNFTNEFSPTLPAGLEVLDLGVNRINGIKHLPSSIKDLKFAINYLGHYSGDCFEFPVGLESLDLDCNGINEAWIKALNLKECVNLKRLNLALNLIRILELENFPKSLIQLDLFNNSIREIKGTFKDFTNLEEINVQSNDLGGFFETTNNLDTFFGENIKFIDFGGNHFTQENVKVLYDELVKYPKFMYLNVDKNVTPHVRDSIELWDGRIGWSRDTD